ncbi:PEP/pyruvate-binding domain-containing protein [Thermodesulfobacteriota bacterium]
MGQILNFLHNIFSSNKETDSRGIEDLRLEFKLRYHRFKLLLNANNRALDIMAKIEQALFDGHPFDMSFIRANSTAVLVEVFRMIRNLDEIAPERYSALSDRFTLIQQSIHQLLTRKENISDKRLTISLDEVNRDMASIIGNKMALLGDVKNRFNIPVPHGFVITSTAYYRFIEHNDLQVEIDRLFQSADFDDLIDLDRIASTIQDLIRNAKVPPDLKNAISKAYRQIEAKTEIGRKTALRSSAIAEDVVGRSFAGQYHSELNVPSEKILSAYKTVLASKYSLTAITYRYNRGIKEEDIAMCVGCLAMMDAVAGGVAYTADPLDKTRNSILISAVHGLPKSVVDGSAISDLVIVQKNRPFRTIRRETKHKEQKIVCDTEGVCVVTLPKDSSESPAIDDQLASELSELAVKIEAYYKTPQDIEWVKNIDGILYLLQCRPIQVSSSNVSHLPLALQVDAKSAPLITGGITASPGFSSGNVFKLEKLSDLSKFPENATLLVRQALPGWAPLMKRAAAVITEQGSFAGHLATVAREFGVPALFGVPKAMQQFETGDLLTVDADNQAVYQGIPETSFTKTTAKTDLMADSPVYNTLQEISRQVVPLNLLDPDSPRFAPQNCSTLHDITRFIHEKSVTEMFNFGNKQNLAERSGKQIMADVPLKWWVLDLDDGFKENTEGPHVRLENIVSIPMLALWDGITSIPWEGPPPVDGKGLAAVMFQATANTALTTGVRSRYAERNYFMISKNFCNLSTRLGFHFSTIESLLGERTDENYISFAFKGGAADFERRLKRIFFLQSILEKYDFNVRVTNDSLTARLENFELEFMQQHLKILGYLTIHTRQIDMVMSNEAAVKQYRQKFIEDIESMLRKGS